MWREGSPQCQRWGGAVCPLGEPTDCLSDLLDLHSSIEDPVTGSRGKLQIHVVVVNYLTATCWSQDN